MKLPPFSLKSGVTPSKSVLAVVAGIGLCFAAQAAAQANWGNSFNYGNTAGSVSVSSTNEIWTTFTAQSNFALSKLWINSNSAMAEGTSMDIALYALDTVTGKPTGTALVSQTVSSIAAGWVAFEDFNYTLSSGTAYAIQISRVSGNPSYLWRYLNSNRPAPFDNTNSVQAGTGNPDPNWARGSTPVASGIPGDPTKTGQLVWLLESDAGVGFGQPITSSVGVNLASATNAVGQRFQFDAPNPTDLWVDSVNLTLSVGETPPVNELTVHLLAADGSILTTGSLDLSEAASGINRYIVAFDTPYEMVDGGIYYLAAYSAGSANNSLSWIGGVTNQANALFQGATFQGTTGYVVAWDSQFDFSSVLSSNLSQDLSFNLGLSAIPEPSSIVLVLVTGLVGVVLMRNRKIRA